MECVSSPLVYAQKLRDQGQEAEKDRLSAYSKRDAIWDKQRDQAQSVSMIYSQAERFERLAQRVDQCSGRLQFAWQTGEAGEMSLRLTQAVFCRVRYCPVCQWRRSLMWKARFYEAMPQIMESYPTARFLLLTITQRNPHITELKSTLQEMGKAWHRLIKRKAFTNTIEGWIRTTEVTKGKSDPETAHPHFHCLLMVKSSYFGGNNYIKKSEWVELWRKVARLDYSPNIDIRAVKWKAAAPQEERRQALESAAIETLKYAVKPADMVEDDSPLGQEWFLEMTRQTHKLRFIAAGGVLKEVLKADEESNEAMLLQEGEGEPEGEPVVFDWQKERRHYSRNREAEKKSCLEN